jgi:fatty acid desaturase
LRPSNLRNAEIIARALLIWFGSSALASWLIFASGLPRALAVALAAPVLVLAGQGMHLLPIIGHDGSHGNLHRNRTKSLFLGMLVSSLLGTHFDVGFSIWHAEHHRWLNTPRDPDAVGMSRFSAYLARTLLPRSANARKYFVTTLLLALRRWPSDAPNRTGNSLGTLAVMARINLLLNFSVLGLVAWASVRAPLLAVCWFWAPFVAVLFLAGMRTYVEHAGTVGEGLEGSRSYTSPVFTFLFGGANYHLAHHLFRSAPCYRLPALHAWLEAEGCFDGHELVVDGGVSRYPTYSNGRLFKAPLDLLQPENNPQELSEIQPILKPIRGES